MKEKSEKEKKEECKEKKRNAILARPTHKHHPPSPFPAYTCSERIVNRRLSTAKRK